MKAATPTPSRPDSAGISFCLRTRRHTATATPVASAAISAGCSDVTTLTMMKTSTGALDDTMPGTPPICSMIVGISRSGRSGPRSDSGSVGGWVTLLLGGPARTGEGTPARTSRLGLADLVIGVVEHLAAVAHGEAPAHAHGAARF